MLRRLTIIAATVALAAAVPAMGATPASIDTGATALREARTLSVQWGRCPTSVPAHRMLAVAQKAPVAQRTQRAKQARTAWQRVVRQCSVPVPTISVVVGS